jgi:hypothetical protein
MTVSVGKKVVISFLVIIIIITIIIKQKNRNEEDWRKSGMITLISYSVNQSIDQSKATKRSRAVKP